METDSFLVVFRHQVAVQADSCVVCHRVGIFQRHWFCLICLRLWYGPGLLLTTSSRLPNTLTTWPKPNTSILTVQAAFEPTPETINMLLLSEIMGQLLLKVSSSSNGSNHTALVHGESTPDCLEVCQARAILHKSLKNERRGSCPRLVSRGRNAANPGSDLKYIDCTSKDLRQTRMRGTQTAAQTHIRSHSRRNGCRSGRFDKRRRAERCTMSG